MSTVAQTQSPQKNTIISYLSNESFKNQIKSALPKHMNPDRMIRIAMTEVRKTPKLQECNPISFMGAIIQCSQLGLEPGNNLGHAYLLPYGKECQLIIGYRGMIDLARRSGQIIKLIAQDVYENDFFEYEFGLSEKLRHIPAKENRGKLISFYALAQLKDGGNQFEVMSKQEIDSIMTQSKSSKFGPWQTHYTEMGKKTVIRRLFKYLPVSIELTQAVTLDEQADRGDQNNSSLADFDLDGVVVHDREDNSFKSDEISNQLALQ